MKKGAAFLLLLLLFLLLPNRAVFAAQWESRHVNYITDIFNEENGLPTGEANALLQSKDGYLWIGSYGGLLRYDGSSFVDFSDRLASTAIRSLYESRSGALYIGTNDAGAFRFRDGVFTPLPAEDEHSFLCIRGFAEGKNGDIYAASPSGAAKLSGDRLIPYAYPELKNGQIRDIAVDRRGNLWAMSENGEIYVFNDQSFLMTVSSDRLFDEAMIYSVSNDPSGSIYVGSSEGQIVHLSLGRDTRPAELDSYLRKDYAAGEVGSIHRIKAVNNGMVLVSALNGFGFLDADGVFHRVDRDGDNILSANWAERDHEGNFWVASSNYGVIRYSVGCFDSCNYNSNLGDYTVNAVARAGERFYLGTDGGLMIFDLDWNPVETELTELLRGIRIRNITVDASGQVWMATYSAYGALCYDPATGRTLGYGEDEGLNSEKVRVVYALSDGRMLVGNQLGVNIIKDGKITESYSVEDGMETASVLCAMELDGRIYVGTDGSGIYEITGQGLRSLSFDQGLSQGVVLRMEPDAAGNGNYYVCAGDKLYYCEKDRFRLLSGMNTGSGSIYSVYDVNGRIWALQNGGIYSADKASVLAGQDSYTAHYGVKCGLTGTLSANTWNWRDEDGTLYIPTRSGVSLFRFQGPKITMPRAILNSVTVDELYYEHPSALEIPSEARRVTMDISELLFSETTEFLLGYRLEGFDAQESFSAKKHVSVSYTNLRGGSYSLVIRIIDPLTGESARKVEIPIHKQKRITEQAWFHILCLLAGALIVLLLARLAIRRRTLALIKTQEEQRKYISSITKVFSECVDMRDTYTNGHSARVAKYTALLAKKLGKSREEAERMYSIALLHDVGKISIPDAVLNKPGRLTEEEYAVMRSHARRGYEVLRDIVEDPELALGAGYHHERFDGSGYPEGLRGEEIPEVARIIAVVDAFDAMYSTRPYRKKMALGDVVEEIRRGAGTQFSPEVVEAFLQLVEEGAFDGE